MGTARLCHALHALLTCPYSLPACLPSSQRGALSASAGLCWQAAFLAASAYIHCPSDPGDASAAALLATLRKRLSLAHEALPPYLQSLQVGDEASQTLLTMPNCDQPGVHLFAALLAACHAPRAK